MFAVRMTNRDENKNGMFPERPPEHRAITMPLPSNGFCEPKYLLNQLPVNIGVQK